MKKGLLFLAVALIAMSPAFAQLSGGLKAGLNLANMHSSSDGYNMDMLIGFHLGAYADFAVSESFSVQPELVFSNQGSKQSYSSGNVNYDTKVTTGYLNLPILAKIKIAEIFNVHVGPQIGLLLSAKGTTNDVDTDAKNSFKTIELGAAVGVGADLPMGLSLAARYNLGLTDIVDNDIPDRKAIKNGVIQVSIGYKLFSK